MLLVPINPNVTQRETEWICVCPKCQQERIVTYAQKWNIEKGNSSDKCRDCKYIDGEWNYNLDGLKLGRKKHQTTKTIINKGTFYKNLFIEVSDETKLKQRNAKLGKFGKESNRYTTGSSKERKLAASRDEYKQLRKDTFERDKYTCQICNKRGGYLEMDHIKEWCNYPELRYELSNCRTLCKPCHSLTDNYGSKAKKRII